MNLFVYSYDLPKASKNVALHLKEVCHTVLISLLERFALFDKLSCKIIASNVRPYFGHWSLNDEGAINILFSLVWVCKVLQDFIDLNSFNFIEASRSFHACARSAQVVAGFGSVSKLSIGTFII